MARSYRLEFFLSALLLLAALLAISSLMALGSQPAQKHLIRAPYALPQVQLAQVSLQKNPSFRLEQPLNRDAGLAPMRGKVRFVADSADADERERGPATLHATGSRGAHEGSGEPEPAAQSDVGVSSLPAAESSAAALTERASEPTGAGTQSRSGSASVPATTISTTQITGSTSAKAEARTASRSIASLLSSFTLRDADLTVPLQQPAQPHAPLMKELFASGDAVPEPGCEAKWGYTWLRQYHASREVVCVAHSQLNVDPALPFTPRPGPLAWHETGWTGDIDSEYGVRLGQTQGSEAVPAAVSSQITRWRASTGSHFSWMRNVQVDFGKMIDDSTQHGFSHGFITASCDTRVKDLLEGDQGAQVAFTSLKVLPASDPLTCDSWIHTPTMIVQHEDIGNTYHNLGDFLRAWIGTAILSAPVCVPQTDTSGINLHGPTGSVRAGDGIGGYIPTPSPCPNDTVRVPGLNPDSMQLMTMDARYMCGTIDIHGKPIEEGSKQDCLGPYFPQYNTWFGQGVVRARDFGKQKVCFSALGFAAATPESHVWDHFGDTNPCATSPLLRSYSEYVAERWGLANAGPKAWRTDKCRDRILQQLESNLSSLHPPETPTKGAPFSLTLPDWVAPYKLSSFAGVRVIPGPADLVHNTSKADCALPYVRVVYVARKTKPFNSQPVSDRVVANEPDFFAALHAAAAKVSVDLELVEADFAVMPYKQQVMLSRSASILIGMHGAGLVHGLDLADADECGGPTGVCELFPKDRTEKGIRNMVVQVGKRYWTWQNTDANAETDAGTVVSYNQLASKMTAILSEVLRARTSCTTVLA